MPAPPSGFQQGLDAKIDRIERGVQQLHIDLRAQIQGLGLIVSALSTHQEMLAQILAAAAAEPGGESPLADLLARLATAITEQTAALERIEVAMTAFGRGVEDAVVRGVRLATGDGIDLPA